MLFGRKRRATEAEVRSILGEGRVVAIDNRANFFGLESAGVTQIRGNGCLGASHDELVFIMWFPWRVIQIRREQIIAVERAKSHLGKTIFRPLLRVRFTDDRGAPDSAAWYVRDLMGWEAALAA